MTATAKDIIKAAQQQAAALQKIESAINTQIAAIKNGDWDTPLSQVDLDQIAALRTQLASVLAAAQELSYVTMNALDNSADIQKLTAALQGVTQDLNSRAAAIAAVGGAAANIGAIGTAITNLIKQLQAL